MTAAIVNGTDVPAETVALVNALFLPDDAVTIRPIETWGEEVGGEIKKKSRVVYKRIRCCRAKDLLRPDAWRQLQAMAAAERANLFFGVCPRWRADRGYDLSWQIRTVRALWLDIDHCAAEEALRRSADAGLPRPSVIVRSGNGVHLYWLLAEPYLIDDVGAPPQVFTDFIDQGPGKKKKPLHYFDDPKTGVRVYEFPDGGRTRNPNWPAVSPRGVHVQRVIAGIAATVGGDHTQDVSRILRLTGTLNRKDQRNGREPVPCVLVECDAGRRYPLKDFERFAGRAPGVFSVASRRHQNEDAGAGALPDGDWAEVRERLLEECKNASDRSGADFHAMCEAIEYGIGKDEFERDFCGVGKIAERGSGYLDGTWVRAEAHVGSRAGSKSAAGTNDPTRGGNGHGGGGEPKETQAADEAVDDGHRLSRTHLERFTLDGVRTLHRHREQYHVYEDGAYRAMSDDEVNAGLTAHIKAQFDAAHPADVKTWEDRGRKDRRGKDSPRPTVRKVTTGIRANARLALDSLAMLSSKIEPPTWLDPDFELAQTCPPCEVLACRNGLGHLPTLATEGVLYPPTPLFFTQNALPYDYDAQAPTPFQWLAFLAMLWPNDKQAVETLQEIFGYALTGDTRLQKIFMLVGPPRCGKGTIARILAKVIGKHNVCAPTLASMATNFGRQPLLGKTLAVIADARLSGRTDATAVVEALLSISGEDVQTIDRKNLPPVTTKLQTRFLILTNELPRLPDSSGALVGRLVILHMTESWLGREDTALEDKLTSELPGILLWAIEGWKRLRDRGHFIVPDTSAGLACEMEDLASPVGAFLRDACEVGHGYQIEVKELYRQWCCWCTEKGRKEHGTEQTFGRDLRAAVPSLIVSQPRKDDGRVRMYEGVRLACHRVP